MHDFRKRVVNSWTNISFEQFSSTSFRCEMDKTAWEGNAKQASYIEWISSTIDEL